MDTQTEAAKSLEHGNSTVSVEVNGKAVPLHRGNRSVVEIKDAAGCPQTFELEQIENGKLVALADNARVEIKGGERFICHPRDGASS